jgi:hypothetical protein
MARILYAPLTDYAWRIWLYAPLMPDAPLTFRTGPKKKIFFGIYTQQYTTIYTGV